MADRVPKVDEIAQTRFTFVYGYYVGFYGDGTMDNRKEERLGGGTGGDGTACRTRRRRLDSGKYFGGSGFEEGEFGCRPYRCGLGVKGWLVCS